MSYKSKINKAFSAMVLFAAAMLVQACAAGMQLVPTPADPLEVKGKYDLILYGCRYADDVENMAILVAADRTYPFAVDELDSMYTVMRGIPASQALEEANTFIHCGMHTVWKTAFRRIEVGSGQTIGYELKPIYRPLELGVTEPLLSSYFLKDGKVTARMTLDPEAEKALNAANGKSGSHDN